MRLTGPQLQQIQAALLDAYSSVDELRMFVRYELDANLNAVAGGDNLRVVIFNLLTWAEQHGRLTDLIAAACKDRPGNAALGSLQSEVRHWFAAKPSASQAPVQAAKPIANNLVAVVAIEWIAIPAGAFLMGSDKSKDKRAHEGETPQHSRRLPEYHIARHPITNVQYLQFVRATGHRSPGHWVNGKTPAGKEHHPVVGVSWFDARAYCMWASKLIGRSMRLPSETEWEKAARGADGRIWPWGDEPPDATRCNFSRNVGDTTPVGNYPGGASPYGVLDMAGNVWEWTNARWAKYPYDAWDGRENSDGPEDDAVRVLRGGAFLNKAGSMRCAARNGSNPSATYENLGFRVVLLPDAAGL